jgi:Txe/YoeB family toxin of Txe-Axe toxin-antitoxin module
VTHRFDQYKLDEVIADAARGAFGAAIAENPEHDFFAFALTTLSGAQYIECSLNSERNLSKILARANDAALRDVFGSDAAMRQYYKWHPNEWADFEYFAERDRDFFAPVQRLLDSVEADADASALAEFGLTKPPKSGEPHFDAFWRRNDQRCEHVYDMMLSALEILDREGRFGEEPARRRRIVFADIYDDDASSKLRSRSIDQINSTRSSPALIQEFRDASNP